MNKFWQFARMMLYYRRLLLLALGGAVVDALCALGGFGALTWIVRQFFEEGTTIRQLVREWLIESNLQQYISDPASLANYIPAGQMPGLAFALGIILLLALTGSTGRFIHQYNVYSVSLRTVMRIRKRVFIRLVHLPMATASLEGTGQQISKIVRDCAILARGFNALMSRAVRGVFVGVALLLGALYMDWMLSLLFLAVLPPTFILIRKFGKKIRRATQRANQQYGVMLGAITESLQALRVLKVHHTEGYERRRFNRINRAALRQEMRARAAKALSSPLTELMAMAAVMAVVLIAAWSVFESAREPADLVMVLGALGASAASFRTMANLNNDLQEAAAAAVRVDQVLKLPTESSAREEYIRRLPPLPRHRRSVVFDRVGFTYPGTSEPALEDINLTVERGTYCAVVGANGSGKSTLLGLLPRLYEPTEGRILIDGADIATRTLRSLRRQIAMVTQDTVLFDASIADNLIYGSRHATEEQMVEAARRAHIHEFIESLPDGYRTPIGERGQRLSGGQRQRIAIARAILRDPAILILDEATSQIDADSEQRIAEAMNDFVAGRTTFVIAHRLSTVIEADRIVVLDAGRIEATGTHTQLLHESPVYHTLCRTQLGGLPDAEHPRTTRPHPVRP